MAKVRTVVLLVVEIVRQALSVCLPMHKALSSIVTQDTLQSGHAIFVTCNGHAIPAISSSSSLAYSALCVCVCVCACVCVCFAEFNSNCPTQ